MISDLENAAPTTDCAVYFTRSADKRKSRTTISGSLRVRTRAQNCKKEHKSYMDRDDTGCRGKSDRRRDRT